MNNSKIDDKRNWHTKEKKLININNSRAKYFFKLFRTQKLNILYSLKDKISKNIQIKSTSQELTTNDLIKTNSNIKISNKKIFNCKNINKKILISLLGLLSLLLIIFFAFNNKTHPKFPKIEKINKNNKKRALEYSNKYDSFASTTRNNYCKYFIDGKDYYQDLYDHLLNAKKTIYITDFHINPELFLVRPVDEKIYLEMAKNKILTKDLGKNMSRLMDILDYKAKEGVKIYILLYYDYFILKLNSKYTQNIFSKLNKNINLIRFPKDSKNILWSNHEKLVIIDDIIGYVGGFNLCWGSYDNNKHPIYEGENKEQIYEFPFKDYDNQRITNEATKGDYTKNNRIRFKEPRLPWHDIHARIDGPTVEDFSNHFIDRWNYAVSSEVNEKSILPYIKDVLEFNVFENIKKYFNKNNQENKFLQKNHEYRTEKINKDKMGMSDVQALRSISNWSIGLKKTETSILKAYCELIENSKHYIYIENQYFISKSYTDDEKKEKNINKYSNDELVKNEISLYIRKRIEKAYENNENFKVFVFIPLIAAYPGDLEKNQGLQLIYKHMYKTINRNNGLSLIELLEKKMGDKWKNYIHFFSLRAHGLINNAPKTEIIYIHSKLLIVDDTKVLISSANINDRSMLGDRDSEFGVIIEEEKHDKYKMNGDKNYKAAKSVVELRKKLMAEHLGVDVNDPILEDPVDNELFELMISRAQNNTQIYHYLFKCYPNDEYTTFDLIPKTGNKNDDEWRDVLFNKYMRKKDQIVGHIVEFPLNFLKNDKFGKALDDDEFLKSIFPEKVFT